MNVKNFDEELKDRLKDAEVQLQKARDRYSELFLLNTLYEEEKKKV